MRYRATFSILFYCRKAKQNKKGEAPIEMGINFQGERFFINLPRKANPKTFPKGNEDYLNIFERRIRNYEQECLDDGECITVDGIKAFITNGYSRPGKSIESMWNDFYSALKHRVSAGKVSPGVCRKYELVWEKFLEQTGLDIKQRASSISPGTVRRFCEWLDNNYENSSSCGMQTKLKSVFIFGKDNGYLDIQPFKEKIVKVEKVVKIPSEAEFERIKTTPLHNQSLEKVRDLWVFAAGCGLAYCDCSTLHPEDFEQKDGLYYISKQRLKTKINYMSILLPWAVEIAKRYNYMLPVISNQKINAYLKTIGDICGVKVSLHFHLARHYYCHQLLNKYKIDYATAAKMLGHSQLRQTMHYGKLWDCTVIDTFKTHISI